MHDMKFIYLYRDAGNYKRWSEIIFSNPEGIVPASMSNSLRGAFLPDGLFVAHQIRVPSVFLWDPGEADSDDHCFHEFHSVEATEKIPDDQYHRSISQFLMEVLSEAKRGWAAFDPHEYLPATPVIRIYPS